MTYLKQNTSLKLLAIIILVVIMYPCYEIKGSLKGSAKDYSVTEREEGINSYLSTALNIRQRLLERERTDGWWKFRWLGSNAKFNAQVRSDIAVLLFNNNWCLDQNANRISSLEARVNKLTDFTNRELLSLATSNRHKADKSFQRATDFFQIQQVPLTNTVIAVIEGFKLLKDSEESCVSAEKVIVVLEANAKLQAASNVSSAGMTCTQTKLATSEYNLWAVAKWLLTAIVAPIVVRILTRRQSPA